MKTTVFVVTSEWCEYTNVHGVANDLGEAKALAVEAYGGRELKWKPGQVDEDTNLVFYASEPTLQAGDYYTVTEYELRTSKPKRPARLSCATRT
jgi:hypothetical protein